MSGEASECNHPHIAVFLNSEPASALAAPDLVG
jgi:hypothetical protein